GAVGRHGVGAAEISGSSDRYRGHQRRFPAGVSDSAALALSPYLPLRAIDPHPLSVSLVLSPLSPSPPLDLSPCPPLPPIGPLPLSPSPCHWPSPPVPLSVPERGNYDRDSPLSRRERGTGCEARRCLPLAPTPPPSRSYGYGR